MRVSSYNNRKQVLPIINDLILSHRKFQQLLDLITASENQVFNVEALIEIRQFNIDCLTKYSDLLSKPAIHNIHQSLKTPSTRFRFEESEGMWQIHNFLSHLIPQYSSYLRDKRLNSMMRTIITRNFDKLIALKDNLLHPIQEVGTN